MRRIPIEYAKEGDVLGKTLYNEMGGMLLKEGSNLNWYMIEKLKSYGYLSIYIKDKYTEEDIEEIIKPEVVNRIYSLQGSLNNVIRGSSNENKIDSKKVRSHVKNLNEIIKEVAYDIVSSKNVLENLASISIYDDYTLTHSLNMMMLSIVIARDIGFNMNEIKSLATGCVFHDIGKIFLPIELINKPGKFTDEEFSLVQSHTEKGYRFLTDHTDLSAVSRNISLCHHEREDGLGYPRGLKGDEIHIFNKIASISDVFDALTSDRPYRRAVPLHDAMEYLLASGGNHFDIDLIKVFSQSINVFPKDTFVHLSDNREGIVYEINSEFHTRPKIKVYGENGKKVAPYIINLKEHNNIVIEKVIHVFSFDKTN
ncbi:HD-GYP domain-containing protein [Tissierella pigra]|uniref:HD-GYP domain-containing protein n=1 Tax=Tissierella pigra TaxID=2607614 RepID=A0A6N7XMV2_9FIRM|nr:HD-GYP domain-containing protein [Tissierella pigra]MBU5426012.1 HD-GYP domain-containing protein [Tissierella pigra]MSU03421.1 HD-GYP domain-containing protein [Tissierella pigra]